MSTSIYMSLILASVIGIILFVICSKGVILKLGFGVKFRLLLKPLIIANILALLASIPISSFNKDLFFLDLSTYLKSYIFIAAWGTALYFLITFLIEFYVIKRWIGKRKTTIKSGKIGLFVLLGNILSFIVLTPIYFNLSQPTHSISEFTDDSSWASRPFAEIYFVDTSSGHLCSILSNGTNKQVLIPDKVVNFQVIPSRNIFLYRNQSNDLYLFRSRDQKRVLCWETDQRFWMNQVACSPDGKIVAYLMKVDRHGPFELMLFNPEKELVHRSGVITDQNEYFPELAWTESNVELILKHADSLDRVIIGEDFSVEKIAEKDLSLETLDSYGRFAWSRGGNLTDWWPIFSSHSYKNMNATIWEGSYLDIQWDSNSLHISDLSGIFVRTTLRVLRDIHILENGDEIIFNDQKYCYLFDVNQRRLGKITNGKNFMLFTDRYKRKLMIKQ